MPIEFSVNCPCQISETETVFYHCIALEFTLIITHAITFCYVSKLH